LVSSRLSVHDFPIILVPDTHHALMQLAQEKRAAFKNPIITVTGSCGKTTTRALLESVFSEAGKVLASVKSFNNNIGVPLTLMPLDSSYDFAICELGANHAGELAELTALVRPKVAIITNAAAVHLEGFGSVEGVAKAKGEIFQGLSEDGVAIINNDDHFADYWRELTQAKKQVSFGLENSADVRAENIIFNEKIQPEFDLILPSGKARVKLNLMGLHNVNNALAAAAAAFALGLSVAQIKAGLENSVAVEKRLVEIKGLNGATVIDDSYNANPLSVMAAISVLAKRKGHSILVLGDMKELGENAADFHVEIGQKAKQLKISQLYAYGDLSRHTAKAFGKNGFYFDNQDQLISELKKKITAKDTILIKGSNSMGMDLVAKALMSGAPT
jgi:UDP-N-acetylmuramoyl-tripeptide--D-alanyl-D-alanine ligase